MIKQNGKEFKANLSAWLDKFKIDADKGVRAIAQRAFENIVYATPVGNPELWKNKPPIGYVGGYARANWYPSVNQKVNVAGNGSPGKPGASLDLMSSIAGGKAGDIFYIQNSVPYILALENGHSTQAPAGIVSVTLANMQTFFGQYWQGAAR